MTQVYRHTQIGWVTLISLGVTMLLAGYVGIPSANWIALSVSGILVICIVLFANLTVMVNGSCVAIAFGVGVIRRRLRLEEIVSCTQVRNRWWYGWGIRKIPKGWLFNVSGLDAVELTVRTGRVYRIGTDEPRKLTEFIQRKLREGQQ